MFSGVKIKGQERPAPAQGLIQLGLPFISILGNGAARQRQRAHRMSRSGNQICVA